MDIGGRLVWVLVAGLACACGGGQDGSPSSHGVGGDEGAGGSEGTGGNEGIGGSLTQCGTLVDCFGLCVDVTSDEANCGTCGTSCAAGGWCIAGTCQTHHSPYAVAYSSDSSQVAVSDRTAGELVILETAAQTPQPPVQLSGEPKGLAWSGANRVMVAEYGAGTIAEVDTTAGSVVRRLTVGPKPTDVAVNADHTRVLVPDFGLGQVQVLDGASGEPLSTIPVEPYPFEVAFVPGRSMGIVSHLLPSGDATRSDAAASVTLVDVAGGAVTANIRLPFGSSSVRGVDCSPDGKWAYAVHLLGRTTVPTTHLLRGWISTNALSIIDLSSRTLYATVLLDRISEGAADPWGVAVSPDGDSLWVSAAGKHQVLRVDLALLHQLMAGNIPSELRRGGSPEPTLQDRYKSGYTRPLSDVWFEIAADPSKRSLLMDDLGALYGAGALDIVRLDPAQGPRGIAISADGNQLAVAMYFAGQVGLIDTTDKHVEEFIDVGTQPEETWARQGERLFHDASSTPQGWLSCATCHPDGRSDGLNWDLLNDGAGNPKNSKSLVYAPNTPPAMAHGVRADAGVAVSAGFKFIKFTMPEPEQELAVATYLNTLTAERDPYRENGQHTAAAQRGAEVFQKAHCGSCHSGTYSTDLGMYDTGTLGSRDLSADSAEFDTPTLADLWRTAPYLHDGSAATLKDVLTTKNAQGLHGSTAGLTAAEIDDLVQYLLELDVPAPEHVDLFTPSTTLPPQTPYRGQSTTPSTLDSLDLTDPKLAVLDKILFIKRHYLPTQDHFSGGHMCDQYHGFNAVPGGGLFVLENVLSGNPTERNVLANSTCQNGPHQGQKLEGGGFLSPDLHYDGNQIVFAYTDIGQKGTWNEQSTFHIFKVNADGSGLTQLTSGANNDFDPTWLPDGRIAFISDRRGGYGRCHQRSVPVYTLHVMNADGTGIEAISLHDTNEWHPSVDNNGLLLFSRWDYVDRGSNQVHHAWVTTPDGLDSRAIGTNYATRSNVTPRALMNIRAIPGSNKLVGTAAAHHQQAYGSLVIVDPDIEDDDGMAQYTVLTEDAGFPEATVGQNDDHKYATAWPIDEDRFLVVHDPRSNEHGLTNKRFGIYLIDRHGNRKHLYDDPNESCLDPIPLAPRKAPPVIPSTRLIDETEPTIVTLLNVYDSLLPFPAGTRIDALRVVQIFPKATPNTIEPRLGHSAILYNDQNGRGSLGTVPVESDGSASFLLPPGKAVYFQALDEEGLVVQSMRSDTYSIPGTTRITCQGCHERRYRAPRPRAEMPLAMLKSPSELQPEADGSMPLSYARLIQPLWDQHCTSCHEENSQTFSLATGNYQSDGDWFFTSYRNLQSFISYHDYPYDFGPSRTIPGEFGARTSRLYPLLADGHRGVMLSDQELRTIALWLDLNADMYSDAAQRDAQARGEAITPTVE